MTQANSRGGRVERYHYEIFDELPAIVRRALAEADYDLCAEWLLFGFEDHRNASALVASIRREEIRMHQIVANRQRRTVFCRYGAISPQPRRRRAA